MLRRGLRSWGGLAVMASVLVACVAFALRALLVRRDAMPCQKRKILSGKQAKAGGGEGVQGREPEDGPSLCPQLLVPEGKECKLVVPKLPLGGLGNGDKVCICDEQGLAVLRASYTYSSGNGRGQKSKEFWRLQLTSATGEIIFASCRDAEAQPGAGGPIRLTLHRSSGDLFGSLSADGYQAGSGYSVISQKGCAVYFRAGLKAGVMNATDDSGRLLAVIEPSGPSQNLLRVGQLVDAGLITLAVMGIEILQHSGAAEGRGADQPAEL